MTDSIILASTSTYRQNLLREAQIPFEAHPPLLDEAEFKSQKLSPFDLVRTLSTLKAQSLRPAFPDRWILGSDQALVFDSKVLSKPGSPEANIGLLMELQGQSHLLMTGAYLSSPSEAGSTYLLEVAIMKMKPLSEEQIRRYVESDKAWDCAGGYKYESMGHTLFESVEVHDPLSIQGLPIKQIQEWWASV